MNMYTQVSPLSLKEADSNRHEIKLVNFSSFDYSTDPTLTRYFLTMSKTRRQREFVSLCSPFNHDRTRC